MTDSHFSSLDKKHQLIIRSRALDSILAQCLESGKNETGGVIIGYYSDKLDEAIATQISHRPSDSESGRFSFIRGVEGLTNLFKKIWSYRRYYLGEWHFHPFAKPSPSKNDFEAIKEIKTNSSYNCKVPILLIIGGNPNKKYQIRSFACLPDNSIVELKRIK